MKLLPVIVLYRRGLADSVTYQSLLADFSGTIFVYDNSPEAHVITRPETIYLHDPQNSGISKAYNVAADYANKNGFEWLLFLDQDSCFPKNAMKIYREAIQKHPEINLFAPELVVDNEIPFSPAKYVRKLPKKVLLKRDMTYPLSIYSPVNSGVLVRLSCFLAAGGYCEKVWLDLSDFVFMDALSKISPDFYLLDFRVRQSVGEQKPSMESELVRFRIYLECIRNCPRKSILDGVWYFRAALRRTLSLCLHRRNLVFLKEFFRRNAND